MAVITMHYDRGKLERNLSDVDDKMRKAITFAFDVHADKATAYMKANAPWTDRTGNARSGLFTTVATGLDRNHWEMILSHSMYYGIYLEVCNSGKYQIIMPTVRHIGDMLIRNMSHLLDRIEAGQ